MVPSGPRRWILVLAAVAAVGLLIGPMAQAPASRTRDLEDLRAKALSCNASGELPTVTMSPAELDRRLADLHERFEGMPGFVDVYFYPGQDPAFRPMFVESVPDEARDVSTPVPVGFDVLPEAPRQASQPLPDTDDLTCFMIRPGAMLTTGCTVNFVYTNGTDFFIGTAGHCIAEGQKACLQLIGCIGHAIYSTGDQGVGRDFALIEIAEDRENLVDPEMCDVGGPTGSNEGDIFGQAVLRTGHGGTAGAVSQTPPRPAAGVGIAWGSWSFTWAPGPIPGDSGSPIRDAEGEAMGTVTHVGIVPPGLGFGTRWDHGLDLATAQDDVPDDITLVTVAETHPT